MDWTEHEQSLAQHAIGTDGTWWLVDDIHGWTADLISAGPAGAVISMTIHAETEEQIKLEVEEYENVNKG